MMNIVFSVIANSNVLLDFQTLTTTQHDSMDEVVEATSKMEPGFNARTKQDPRYSSIVLGDGSGGQVLLAAVQYATDVKKI